MELDLKALAAGLATAAFFSFAAHAHPDAAARERPVAGAPAQGGCCTDACRKATGSAARRCPSAAGKAD